MKLLGRLISDGNRNRWDSGMRKDTQMKVNARGTCTDLVLSGHRPDGIFADILIMGHQNQTLGLGLRN